MARVLTEQADLDRIFKRMEKDYAGFSKRQEAYAIREIGRVRGEVAELLAEHADSKGVIKRNRAGRVLRDLDDVEEYIRRQEDEVSETMIENTSAWTSDRLGGYIGLSASAERAVNKHVVKDVVKRFGDDGLVLSDRVWGLSGEIRDELSSVIRSG